jgi:hypothetical protein
VALSVSIVKSIDRADDECPGATTIATASSVRQHDSSQSPIMSAIDIRGTAFDNAVAIVDSELREGGRQ